MNSPPNPFYDLGNTKYCNISYSQKQKQYEYPRSPNTCMNPPCPMRCQPMAYPNEVNVPNYGKNYGGYTGKCSPSTKQCYCDHENKKSNIYYTKDRYYLGSK